MAIDDEEALKDVEFIPAYEDARLRLDCFIATRDRHPAWAMDEMLKEAQKLYDWVMEIDEEPDVVASAEEQHESRKH